MSEGFGLAPNLAQVPTKANAPGRHPSVARATSKGDALDRQGSRNRSKKTPPLTKIELLQAVATARRLQRMYWDTIGDAAILAVNQVQDKRIEFLRKGPDVTATDLFLDIFLAVAAQFGGVALGRVTDSLINRVLRTRTALGLITARSQLGGAVVQKQRKLEKEGLVDVLLRKHEASKLYDDVVFETIELGKDFVGSVVKAVNKKHKARKKAARIPQPSPNDSGSVALLKSVSSVVRRQQAFDDLLLDHFELEVAHAPRFEPEDYRESMEALQAYTKPLLEPENSLAEIRELYALHFEAGLWVSFVDFKGFTFTTDGGSGQFFLEVKGAPVRAFTNYLVRRLRHPNPAFDTLSFLDARGHAQAVHDLRDYLVSYDGKLTALRNKDAVAIALTGRASESEDFVEE